MPITNSINGFPLRLYENSGDSHTNARQFR
jgi:hypothetical protein